MNDYAPIFESDEIVEIIPEYDDEGQTGFVTAQTWGTWNPQEVDHICIDNIIGTQIVETWKCTVIQLEREAIMPKRKVAIPPDGYIFKPQGFLEKNDLIWNGVKFKWDSFSGSLSFMIGFQITKAMTVAQYHKILDTTREHL